MKKHISKKSLLDGYQFFGFKTLRRVKGRFKDNKAIVISLARRQKKLCVAVAERFIEFFMIVKSGKQGISVPAAAVYLLNLNFDVLTVRNVVA